MTRRAPLAVVGAVVGATAFVALLAAFVFLARAGGDPADAATWPITWELRSSDNGTLFQFWSDAVAGRTLDWSFSPQVFVFPELPLSGIAYAIAGGDVFRYYLVVAMLAAAAFFLVLLALARVCFRGAGWGGSVARAAIAVTPLLALPLVGTSWVLSFHLAPTYYLGMYLALLAAPLLITVRRPGPRIVVGVALALTIASNPLTLVFAAPGAVIAAGLLVIRGGWRPARTPLLTVGAVLVVSAVARIAMTPLQGTGLLTYMSAEVFQGRLAALEPYWSYQLRDPGAAVLLVGGAILAIVCLVGAVAAAVRILSRRSASRTQDAVRVALGLVPVGGLAATFVVMITHYYYFWPALVLPWVLVPLALPTRALRPAVVTAAGAGLAVAIGSGAFAALPDAGRYFGFRTAETVCLDDAVPGQVGYATFSDARRLSLPSATGIRLIPTTPDLHPNLWLTNRTYARDEAGTFFYLNGRGDELAFDADALRSSYGEPAEVVSCGDAQTIWVYDAPVSLPVPDDGN